MVGWREGDGEYWRNHLAVPTGRSHLQRKGHSVRRSKINKVRLIKPHWSPGVLPYMSTKLYNWTGFVLSIIVSNMERRGVLTSFQTPITRAVPPSTRCCELKPSPEWEKLPCLEMQGWFCPSANDWHYTKCQTFVQGTIYGAVHTAELPVDSAWGWTLAEPNIQLASSSVPSWVPHSLVGFTCKYSH